MKVFCNSVEMTTTNSNDFHKTGKKPDRPIAAMSKTNVFRISFAA